MVILGEGRDGRLSKYFWAHGVGLDRCIANDAAAQIRLNFNPFSGITNTIINGKRLIDIKVMLHGN